MRHVAPASLLALVTTACAPLAHFEDARTLTLGEGEATLSYASTRLLAPEGSTPPIDEVSVGLRWGLARENTDLRARLTVVQYGGGRAAVLGFGPKFANASATAAFLLPVNLMLDEGQTLPVLAPTALLTFPVHERADLTLGLRTIVTVLGPATIGATGGFGIELADGRWRMRPEAGLTLGGEDAIWHTGLAMSYTGGGH